MPRRLPNADGLTAIRQEIASFIDNFDTRDAEDVQVRTDALVSSMVKAGVLKDSRGLKGFRLHVAIKYVQLPVGDREELVNMANMFHDLISSYGGEPDESDMETAKELLDDIAKALETAICVKINKD